tara:strand:+ start:165 stop:1091 length:927 start_codon:yes stop_codon:yes gene_type:complete
MELEEIKVLLDELSSGNSGTFSSIIAKIASHNKNDSDVSLYHLKADPNGRPMLSELISIIAKRIIHYTIPRKQINAALNKDNESRTNTEFTGLAFRALDTFTELTKTGEGGELLLFTLVESILGYPQVLCKMDLKTDEQVHFHGADGVYLGVENENLCLFWGESKLHDSHSSAIGECLASVQPILNLEKEANRDLRLLSYIDLSDAALEKALERYFDYESESYGKLRHCAVCLVGFDHVAYVGDGEEKLTDANISKRINADFEKHWKATFESHLQKNKLNFHKIIIFYLPVKSVEEFRQVFRKQLRLG